MKTIAIIPARFAASRFPGKLMQKIGDKTIIRMVYDNAVATGLFDQVLVVTDSDEIFNEIKTHGGSVKMSMEEHASGTDRIAEAVTDIDVDIVINIQGDEPFVKKEPLAALIKSFEEKDVLVSSLMQVIIKEADFVNPNIVKVVCNKKNDALYFSRSLIPFKRNTLSTQPIFKHVGVYAFRKKLLLEFTTWPQGILEQAEILEQLRYLENGVSIRMVETLSTSIGIDTLEDLDLARTHYSQVIS